MGGGLGEREKLQSGLHVTTALAAPVSRWQCTRRKFGIHAAGRTNSNRVVDVQPLKLPTRGRRRRGHAPPRRIYKPYSLRTQRMRIARLRTQTMISHLHFPGKDKTGSINCGNAPTATALRHSVDRRGLVCASRGKKRGLSQRIERCVSYGYLLAFKTDRHEVLISFSLAPHAQPIILTAIFSEDCLKF